MPEGNIIILLSPLELKSNFISIETPSSDVNCHHFISYERAIFASVKAITYCI